MTLPAETKAVVVGIEEYQIGKRWSLNGPALDACRFAAWLTGRGVPADQITLLVSPLPENADVVGEQSQNYRHGVADHATVRNLFASVLPSTGSGLLIVYWGGHGVIEGDERRLIYADAAEGDKRNLNLTQLLKCMRTTTYARHPQQWVLIDACSSLSVDLRWKGTLPDEHFAEGHPEARRDQCALFAASPGERAENEDSDKTGRFSRVLREELALLADTWPPDADQLRGAVIARFEQMRKEGHTRQMPSGLWYRSHTDDVKLIFTADPPTLRAHLGRFEQHQVPPTPVPWPVQVGTVPALASAFQPRAALRERIDHTRAGDAAAVRAHVLTGGGGVGKTQLAAAYARQALDTGTELLVWVSAADTEEVTATYSRAAALVQARGAYGEVAEVDARAFLEWLATTARSWLVVLDDITDLDGIAPWWPSPSQSGKGRVLATTRRRDAVLSGSGRTVVHVDTYSLEEATAYLRDRLNDAGAAHLLDDQAAPLAEELGRLPLALGYSAGYMINEDVACAQYRQAFANRNSRLERLFPPGADTEGYGRQVAVALLLSLDAAQSSKPVGLAVPAMHLAALLDPAGHPEALWGCAEVIRYLTEHRPSSSETEVGSDQTRAILRLLHRYGLVTHESQAGPRAVRMHVLTARAVRENTPDTELPVIAQSAASALRALWPARDDTDPSLSAALRTNTDALAAHSQDYLWACGHTVLYRAGESLLNARLYVTAIPHWERLSAEYERTLGVDFYPISRARQYLAESYFWAGRHEEGLRLLEQRIAHLERVDGRGPNHFETLNAKATLANAYGRAGRTDEAIAIQEQVADRGVQVFGPDDPRPLRSKTRLADFYRHAGRTAEAISLLEDVAAATERVLGTGHPDALTTRHNLATTLWQEGRLDEAITLLEQIVAGRERAQGPDDPETLAARSNLARSYWDAGRIDEAIAIVEEAACTWTRVLGPDDPRTLTARGNLGVYYLWAEHTAEAISLLEDVAAATERVLGTGHPDALTTRHNLAAALSQGGRLDEAMTLLEDVAVGRERTLGPDHPETLEARANLATAYRKSERADEAR
ncbi:tetratricopeptide repeat protein [Streptomyces sp. NPDC002668]|uniref:tetratricopeptide repeat protein n=1 Tax=Streptomyces sp. NPDC002668 TaxID=3154422 RepID=UPI003326C32D